MKHFDIAVIPATLKTFSINFLPLYFDYNIYSRLDLASKDTPSIVSIFWSIPYSARRDDDAKGW